MLGDHCNYSSYGNENSFGYLQNVLDLEKKSCATEYSEILELIILILNPLKY